MSVLPKAIDERFLDHRRRSLAAAGMTAGIVAIVLFLWHLLVDHRWSWDLFVIVGTLVGVKLALMAWYTLRG